MLVLLLIHGSECRIDNNEFSGLTDDDASFKGNITFWGDQSDDGERTHEKTASEVQKRLDYRWLNDPVKVGRVGKVTQAMGMAKVSSTEL